MFTTVAGNTDLLVLTTLSMILLVISLIMGLKIRWFRARMDMKATNSGRELESLDGVYRSHPFEVSTSAPLAPQSYNIIAGSSSHTSPISPSSEKLSVHSSILHTSKTDLWKIPTASSLEGPPVGSSQPSKHNRKIEDGAKSILNSASGKNLLSKPTEHNSVHIDSLKNLPARQPQPTSHKEKASDGNKMKFLFPLGKNPLSKQEKHNKPPQNSIQVSSPQNPPLFAAMGYPQLSQNEGKNVDENRLTAQTVPNKNPLARQDRQTKPVEARQSPYSFGQSKKPKGILQKIKPPTLPTTHGDSSHTLNDNTTSLRSNEGSSTSLVLKTPLPLYVLEQDESESLS
jgi:hypothetical protein